MLGSFNRLVSLSAVAAISLLSIDCAGKAVLAQAPTQSASPAVDELLARINAMQRELDSLHERDAFEPAMTPASGIRLVGLSSAGIPPEYDGAEYCDSPADCASSGYCGCSPCECGQCPAPCIDCPRVSTLNPYFNVNIFGALKMDMLFGDARAVSPGTPYFLLPASPVGLSQATTSFHARQSSIGAAITGPRIGSFQAGGMLMAFFYNDNAFADAYGLLPAQAWGDLRNQDWRFAAGLQFDVFNPNAPTILPFSILSGSGNTGNAFRGQVRLERFLNPSDSSQWTLQFALSEPIASVIDPAFRISEDNGWPNVEGRIALGLGLLEGQGANAQRPFEVGVSGVVGQVRNTVADVNSLTINRFVADVWGIGADFRWKINNMFGFMGEFYTGEGLGTYNGAALQLVNPENNYQGIQSTGGWLEFFAYWTPCLHSHFGFGIDDPRDSDVPLAALQLGRVENSTAYANLLYDITQSFRIAFEVSRRETQYRNPIVPDSDGMFFHTQFAWTF